LGIRSLFVSAVAMAAVSVAAAPAYAALSCRDFHRASVLGDQDILAQAARIGQPVLDANKELTDAAGMGGVASDPIMRMVLLSQLADACRSLPDDTVDAIVATLAKSVREAAARAHRAAERQLAPETAPSAPEEAPEKLLSTDTVALNGDQRIAIGDHARECWDPGSLDVDQEQVMLTVTTDATGIARKATVAGDDVGRMGEPKFRAFAGRAIQAILDPQCANLPLPSNAMGKVSVVTLIFSP
jgi:hypothetical protein